MGILDTLAVGQRGLMAANAGIQVASENIAGANTVGYHRRHSVQTTSDPVARRGLWIGGGPRVEGVARSADRILGARLVASSGTSAYAAAMHQGVYEAEGAIAVTGATGLADIASRFFDSLATLTTDPSDPSARQATLGAATQLTMAVSNTATALQGSLDELEASVADRVVSANALISEIASLNKAIGRRGAEMGPADLLDRRDQAIRELAEEVGATVELEASGQATVFVGDHAVVSGVDGRTLSASVVGGQLQVAVSVGGGSMVVQVGGQAGGELAARDTVNDWMADLDTWTSTFSDTFNAQHALGFDSSGAAGGEMFGYDPVDPAASFHVAIDDPDALALAGAVTANPGDGDNLSLLLDLEDSAMIGGYRPSEALTVLAASAGTDVSAAEADSEALSEQLADLDALRSSLSGVDTDEEAISLIEYQAAYRAAARVLSVGDEMLRTLMQVGA